MYHVLPNVATLSPQELLNMEGLRSVKVPVIRAIGTRRGFMLLVIHNDGNCFTGSGLITILTWAVQRPDRIADVYGRLENIVPRSFAFGRLQLNEQVNTIRSPIIRR